MKGDEIMRRKNLKKRNFPMRDFKAYLRFKGIPYRELSEVITTTISTFSAKINNTDGRQFEQFEIYKLSKYLNLSSDDIMKYFFPDDLRNVS